MSLSPDVTVGQLIPLLVLAIGALGAWFTLRANAATTSDATKGLGSRIDRTDAALDTLQRHVDRNCVERSDLKEVETRLNSRISDVEHSVKQVPMQVVGLLNAAPGSTAARRRGAMS
ncbi:hypothetical protein MKK55_18625 [Methylobacterium sp. J-059]|uniref:hypothetical protein n=1 Tax=Methylobacterium sp. J-059 TaxID=2836643 RepID=UPI001FBB76B8|nr:hypothetical protein [Methylobacterium sp. J-059]MCJ2040946.1 hypothetical protein [Methylobacterium sp. J-059]